MAEQKAQKNKNPYKIAMFIAIGVLILVGLYFGFSAVQNAAYQEGVATGQSNMIQQINANQEIPLVSGTEENQSIQWTGLQETCSAMLQQQMAQQQVPQNQTIS